MTPCLVCRKRPARSEHTKAAICGPCQVAICKYRVQGELVLRELADGMWLESRRLFVARFCLQALVDSQKQI